MLNEVTKHEGHHGGARRGAVEPARGHRGDVVDTRNALNMCNKRGNAYIKLKLHIAGRSCLTLSARLESERLAILC